VRCLHVHYGDDDVPPARVVGKVGEGFPVPLLDDEDVLDGVVLDVVGGVVVVVVVVVVVEVVEDVVVLEDVVVGGGVKTLSSPTPTRFGKSRTFWPFRAAVMKSVQMRTGTVPPVSSPTPGTEFMDSC
jgi:hypothetical protein